MKLSKLLVIVLIAFTFACSGDDDEPKPQNLEQATLSLSADADVVVSAPSGMAASDDPNAQQAMLWIQQVNAITSSFQYLQKPSGATKSDSRITASNGRTHATGDYVTYIWNDASVGTVAYQISEASNSYVFEVFFKLSASANWIKFFHGEEKKDKSSGFIKVYDYTGNTGSTSTVLVEYSWTRNGDILNFEMTGFESAFVIQLEVNQKTKAGNVVYIIEDTKQYEMQWDAQGNGSWAYFSDDGEILEEGTWSV